MIEHPVRKQIEHRGCRLSYDLVGSGPAVLFIQGVGVAGTGWQPQTEFFADRFTCISFDNRGMGRSQPPGQVTVEGMAEDARAILDAEGYETAHVVGHSLGGLIAIELALSDPARVTSLGLLCTFARGKSAAPLTARMMWLGARSRVGTRRMRRRGFLGLVSAPGAIQEEEIDSWSDRLSTLFGHDIADQPPVVNRQLRAMRRWDTQARLGDLNGIATLVVSACYDPIAPPELGRTLAAGIEGARYVEVAEASHGLTATHPQLTNELLEELFETAT